MYYAYSFLDCMCSFTCLSCSIEFIVSCACVWFIILDCMCSFSCLACSKSGYRQKYSDCQDHQQPYTIFSQVQYSYEPLIILLCSNFYIFFCKDWHMKSAIVLVKQSIFPILDKSLSIFSIDCSECLLLFGAIPYLCGSIF